MPIFVPGKRDRRNRKVGSNHRSAVATLSLTAMVDMFTVLAVFLLQNYASTDQILYLPEKVQLPQAGAVKELKPSNVIIVSQDGIFLNEKNLVNYLQVKEQQDWMIEPLKAGVEQLIKDGDTLKEKLGYKIQQAVKKARTDGTVDDGIDKYRKLTVQADKGIDFLTVKKVMYTATEAGVVEINFAVMKKEKKKTETN